MRSDTRPDNCCRPAARHASGATCGTLLALLLLTVPACRPTEAARGDATVQASGKAEKKLDPVDVDAEQVLAAMPASWRAMLEKAEAFAHQERMSWCLTCHINIRDALRGGKHLQGEISCVECHGASERHARDENNEIKPDQVFKRGDVDRACGECHECARKTSADEPGAAPKVCSDCHPAHSFKAKTAAKVDE